MVIFCTVQKDVSDVKPAQHFPLLNCYSFSPGLKGKKRWLVIFQIHHTEFILESLLALPAGSTFPLDTTYDGQRPYVWLSKAYCTLLLSRHCCWLPKLFHQNKGASWSFRPCWPFKLSSNYVWRLEKHLCLLLYRLCLWNYTGSFPLLFDSWV